MAHHNLMDYSLLLITEQNPDYQEDYRSVSNNSQIMRPTMSTPFLRRQPSGIPEVPEADEDDCDQVKPHEELIEKLDKSTGDVEQLEFCPSDRVKTTIASKSKHNHNSQALIKRFNEEN